MKCEYSGHKKVVSDESVMNKTTMCECCGQKVRITIPNKKMYCNTAKLANHSMPKLTGNYCTSFCNFAHRLSDGKPVNHECYIIPIEALIAERDGNDELARELLRPWRTNRVSHRGLKV